MSKSTKVAKQQDLSSMLANPSQENVPLLIKAFKEELKKLEASVPDNVKLDLKYDNSSLCPTTIDKITSLKDLIIIHSSVKTREKVYLESAADLGFTPEETPVFTINNHTAKDFLTAIPIIVAKLKVSARTKQLKETIEELSAFLDKDTQIKQKIANLISKVQSPLE